MHRSLNYDIHFMIIDIHTHAWPEKVSRKAKENLEHLFKVPMLGNPTLENLLASMQKNRIDLSVICAVATKPEQVASINDWLFKVRSDKIKAFCAMHPDYPLWETEISRIKERGDGIKFQPEFQGFYVDEERMFPFYEAISEAELPVIFHCGEELSGTLLVRSSAARILKVRRLFPELKIIAAHFGGFRHWQETRELLLGKDLYLDTSYFLHYLPKAEVKELILGHRQDRLLFGTDFPLADPQKDLDFINDLGLPVQLKESILFRNAQELLRL